MDEPGLWIRLDTAAQPARLVREHLVNRAAQIAVDGGALCCLHGDMVVALALLHTRSGELVLISRKGTDND